MENFIGLKRVILAQKISQKIINGPAYVLMEHVTAVNVKKNVQKNIT